MSLKQPPDFHSFSLLSCKLYTTDYQSFIGVSIKTPPFIYPIPLIIQGFWTSIWYLLGRHNPVSYQYGQD